MIKKIKLSSIAKISILSFTCFVLLALYLLYSRRPVAAFSQSAVSMPLIAPTATLKGASKPPQQTSIVEPVPVQVSNDRKEASKNKRKMFNVCFEQLKVYEKLRCKHLAHWEQGSCQMYVFMLRAANTEEEEYARDALSRFGMDDKQTSELRDKFVTNRDRLVTVMIPDDPQKHLTVMEGDIRDPSILLPIDGKILQTAFDKSYQEVINTNEKAGTLTWRYSHLLTIDAKDSTRQEPPDPQQP